MRQLLVEGSHYKWCVSGWPVPHRSGASSHGCWVGVSAISKHPSRALPDVWPQEILHSSRIVVSTTFVADLWVSGITLYGVPIGPTHPGAKAATSQLVTAAIDRLQVMSGPRYLAGDINHDVSTIPEFQRLTSMHFVEVQDLWQARTGEVPKATCKGKTRRDYLWLSPELAALFVQVEIDPNIWADHATIVATFTGGSDALRRYPWPLPKPLPWTQVTDRQASSSVQFDFPTDCTRAYKELWTSIEDSVVQHLAPLGQHVPPQCLGRGKRLERHTVVGTPSPPRKGRQGEFQPRFFGLSYLHAQWIRQVRRLQSYIRLRAVQTPRCTHVEHLVSLWQAIVRASGFAPDFPTWWQSRVLVVGDPAAVPFYPPELDVAEAFMQAMVLEVRNLESRLSRAHSKQLAKKRSTGLSSLYASVRRDAPVPVDVLVESQQATISRADHDLCALELRQAVSFDPHTPLVCNGKLLQPIVVTDDKLFVQSVEGCEGGDLIVQTKSTGRLDDVFQAFAEQWKQRWDKHEGIPHTHWDSLFAFAQARLGRVDAPSPCFSANLVRAIAHGKKAKAAVGLDGVSRSDVLHLTDGELSSIGSIFDRAHHTGTWPLQLTQGQVKSLAKKERPQGVGDYRPITIFSFLYRIWSSISSQHWLKHVSTVVDGRLCGNRNGYRASHLWRAVLDEVETSHGHNQACGGVVFDLEKAFDTLPRLVCLGLSAIIGVDAGTNRAWAGMLGSMTRHFVVLGSLSPPIGASCGFAEGCGMSCLAMLLLDQVLHEWVKSSSALCQPLSYVDNWEVVVRDPGLIQVAAEATFELAAMLDVVVDRSKSFVWGTSREFRQTLRHSGFPIKLDTLDLGAHVTYSKQLRNSSLVARFSGLSDFGSSSDKPLGLTIKRPR